MSNVDSSHVDSSGRAHRQRWQWVVLPLMAFILLGATVFFLYVSMNQLSVVFERIKGAERLDVSSELADLEKSIHSDDIEYARWKSLVLLESYSLSQRHEKGGALILTRVWLKYLGFLTGMIMSLIGSAFVLGKLRDRGSALEGQGARQLRLSLNTTSPGIFLATIGAVLMMTTILSHQTIEVNDAPIYVSTWQRAATIAGPSKEQTKTAESLGGMTAAPPANGQFIFDPESGKYVPAQPMQSGSPKPTGTE